ncbi:MAG TPA: hypothetical protein VH440_10275 [Candidatus Limnocylindrales bacterium]
MRAGLVAGLAALALLLSACSASFDPTGPCTSDGSAPGAYPDLESIVPKTFRGSAPGGLDSGRTCSTDGLGTLKGHGIDELRFAGATWETGDDSGLSLATFRSEGDTTLTPDWVTEFYETSAKSGKNVESVDSSTYPVATGLVGKRIDVLNGESYQSVVVWQREGRIEVALIADFIREIQTKAAHDQVVREAVDAWLVSDGLTTIPQGTTPVEGSPAPAPS